MKHKFLLTFITRLLIALVLLYLFAVNPLNRPIEIVILPGAVIVLSMISLILWSYKFQRETFFNFALLLLVGYYIFVTSTNGIVLGISLAVVAVFGSVLIYFWLKSRKGQQVVNEDSTRSEVM